MLLTSLLRRHILGMGLTASALSSSAPAAKGAIQRLLTVKPSDRMSASAFLGCEWATREAEAAGDVPLDVAAQLSKLRALKQAGHKVMLLQKAGLLVDRQQ